MGHRGSTSLKIWSVPIVKAMCFIFIVSQLMDLERESFRTNIRGDNAFRVMSTNVLFDASHVDDAFTESSRFVGVAVLEM